jgi:hypothetical protein
LLARWLVRARGEPAAAAFQVRGDRAGLALDLPRRLDGLGLDGRGAHPATELLPMMGEAELDNLARDIAENRLLEPVVLWADNTAQKESGQLWGLDYCPRYLLDGRSRLAAIERLGLRLESMRCLTKTPQHPVTVIPAWRRKYQITDGAWPWRYFDPWIHVLSANLHRRHLTQEQRREVTANMLRRRPELSDRAIAGMVAVSDKTVGAVRGMLEANAEIPHTPPGERIEASGRRARGRKAQPVEPPGSDYWDGVVPAAYRPSKKWRFLSPVKWNAPRRARIAAARAYLDYLDLTVDDLTASPATIGEAINNLTVKL